MKKLLGVKFSEFTEKECDQKVKEFLDSEDQHIIFTPNAEMLVDAYSDEYFRETLNAASINLCDSIGVRFFSGGRLNRIHGSDYFLNICEIAEKKEKSIYLLGSGSKKVVNETKEKLKERFPNLKIVGSNPGPRIEVEKESGYIVLKTETGKNSDVIHELIMKSPDILFVAFGHPKQELWIYKHLDDLPGIKIAMGVGGTFDYISDNVKRAPRWMRKIGLEWMYRFIVQPNRFMRILKATVVFPVLFVVNKIKNLFLK